MTITQLHERHLSDDHRQAILELQQLAFPQTEEFKTQRWWHAPLDGSELWIGCEKNSELIGSVLLLFRNVTTQAGTLKLGGIGNVCSHPAHRGAGAAKKCMLAANAVIAEQCDFGLLECGDPVGAFYESLGWQEVNNEVVWQLPDGTPGKTESHVMIVPGRKGLADWPAGTVDLNGPNW